MSRTLFATDLDGTLLNTSSVMTPSHAARLRRLIDDGMLFTVATGGIPPPRCTRWTAAACR